ncbi:MAG TPA: dethiobiotin synthase [Verrucomicrobia bacterium]|nr:MAG: dethiobiotin synthase [Lentisphaerae bacterium GWF2_57_35]HBA83606.1 dethiobiotin synthase [Verrucomicrobiota bacterium]
MQSLFITATDTGVGKTTFSAALLAQARAAGLDAVPMKPVQTGCERRGDRLIAPDLEFCLSAAALAATDEEKELMCPYRFEPACSPHLAAKLAGHPIQLDDIIAARRKLQQRHETLIVEGAGGVLAPIDEENFMIDLMKILNLPVVLVARSGLGTINHTLLTFQALRRARIEIRGIVLSDTHRDEPALIVEDNLRIIRQQAGATPVIRMPFFPAGSLAPQARADRQSVENSSRDFPILGKNPAHFSNHWKIPDVFFQ